MVFSYEKDKKERGIVMRRICIIVLIIILAFLIGCGDKNQPTSQNDEVVNDSAFNNYNNLNHDMVESAYLSKYFIGATKSFDKFVVMYGYRNQRNDLSNKFFVFDNNNQEYIEVMENIDFIYSFPSKVIIKYAPYLSKDGTIYMVITPVPVSDGGKFYAPGYGLYSYNLNTEKLTLIMEADVLWGSPPIVYQDAVYFYTWSEDSEDEIEVKYVRYSLKDGAFTVYDRYDHEAIISANKKHLYSSKNGIIYQYSHKTGESELLIDLTKHELTKDFKAKRPFQVTDEYIFVVLNSKYDGFNPDLPLGSDVVARIEITSGEVITITPDSNKIYSIRSLNAMDNNCFFIADEINEEFVDSMKRIVPGESEGSVVILDTWNAAEQIKATIYQGDSKGNVHVIGETHGVDLSIYGNRLYYSDKGISGEGFESVFKSLKIKVK